MHLEPIFPGNVLLTRSCKDSQKQQKSELLEESHECKVEQRGGQHNGADRDGSGGIWHVVRDWLSSDVTVIERSLRIQLRLHSAMLLR